MKLIDQLKKEFPTSTLVLIPVVIAINIVLGQIAQVLRLPIYLDGAGTIFLAVICGPWAGALTGMLTNIIWGITINPNMLPWFPVAIFIGLVAGFMAKWGWFNKWWKVIVTGFVISIFTTLSATPIAVYLYGGITSSGSSFITAMLLQTGQSIWSAVLTMGFITDPADKIVSALMAYAVLKALSQRYVAKFPYAENVYPKEKTIEIPPVETAEAS